MIKSFKILFILFISSCTVLKNNEYEKCMNKNLESYSYFKINFPKSIILPLESDKYKIPNITRNEIKSENESKKLSQEIDISLLLE